MKEEETNARSLNIEWAVTPITHPKSTPMYASIMNKNSTQWVENYYFDFFLAFAHHPQ